MLFSISVLTARASAGAELDAEDWTRIYAVESPALSVDGTQLSFTWCNTNWTASATGGIARVSATPPRPFDAGPFTNEMYAAMGWDYSLSPDATRAAFRFRGDDFFRRRNGTFSSRAGEIWLYDSRSKTYTNLVRRAGNCDFPVWLGNEAIAYLAQDGRGGCEVRYRNLTTGKDAAIIPAGTHDMANFLSAAKMAAPQTGGPRSCAAASSNEYILVVRHGWDLWRYALDARGTIVDSKMLVFHPETDWNARASVRNRWYDKNWNNDYAETMAATPDGRDIVFTTGGDLWTVKSGKETNAVMRLRGETRSHERNCVLSPDGSIAYYLRDFGDHAEIWGMRRGEPDRPWHLQKRVTNWPVIRSEQLRTRLALSPKGDRLSWVDWQRSGMRGYQPDHLGAPHFSGKIIALVDEGTFSNGEMMAHALKTLKRATLVGRPTAGGVLSTFNCKVLDWGEYRIPHGRWFAEDGTEMENHGAEPDIRVDDTPAEWAHDVDSQLDRALMMIEAGL